MIKKRIRTSIHETNSSSSHSFSMGTRGELITSKLIEDTEECLIVDGSLWEDLGARGSNDPLDKLSYLLTYIRTHFLGDREFQDEGVWPEDIKGWEENRDLVFDVVKQFTGIKNIKYIWTGESIDHQSQRIIHPGDLVDREFIKEFIFNPGTRLWTLWDSDTPERDDEVVIFEAIFELPGIDNPIKVEITEEDDCFSLYEKFRNKVRKIAWSEEQKKFVQVPSPNPGIYEVCDYNMCFGKHQVLPTRIVLKR